MASGGAIVAGSALVIALAGWHLTGGPAPVSQDGGKAVGSGAGKNSASKHKPLAIRTATSPLRGIALPDLLIVLPSGLTARQLARLRAIKGVRKMISFDGAQISVGGVSASVIGVNPGQFRSWVPLRTASNQRLWTKLTAGDFIAETASATRLQLRKNSSYVLTGGLPVEAQFGGSAALDIGGVDLVVNQATSLKLGLVHQVAALISAPALGSSVLMTKVTAVLGHRAQVISLRDRQPSNDNVPSQTSITDYLQLFQASAAKYCPQLSWTVLAAIGQIESGDGRDVGPSSAGALGPMQFLPSTWATWGIDGFGPPGPPDIMNPYDAVPSAARYLCAAGASSGTQDGLRRAIFAYNHADWYVNEVLGLAAQYAADYH
ncbi:MAG TPA: lytic transglycosylase domain-containing protein [Streptosporangiaceae bacterium]|nr:lytic transglycosylase domain-containing protein [Streptosporangiaceae bacterium]